MSSAVCCRPAELHTLLPMYHAIQTHLPSSANAMLGNNGLSVACSLVPGCRIPIDMAIEQTISRSAKSVGGIVSFSRNVNAYSCWCLTWHKKAEYLDFGFTPAQTILHASAHCSNCQHFARDVKQVVDSFANIVNPFAMTPLKKDSCIVCLPVFQPQPQLMRISWTTPQKGEEGAADYIQTRLNDKSVDFYAPMKKWSWRLLLTWQWRQRFPPESRKLSLFELKEICWVSWSSTHS